eukprot:TRINITY_DN393_c0_g1_i2.p1 TRINITY_DN393_c0_g1~~TRINITY_DN393_c0_g1_i2.p1  ORF type:complete len:219 (+),score=-3.20 TRINITY_DN393_c0_g1_i2:312-968(+)
MKQIMRRLPRDTSWVHGKKCYLHLRQRHHLTVEQTEGSVICFLSSSITIGWNISRSLTNHFQNGLQFILLMHGNCQGLPTLSLSVSRPVPFTAGRLGVARFVASELSNKSPKSQVALAQTLAPLSQLEAEFDKNITIFSLLFFRTSTVTCSMIVTGIPRQALQDGTQQLTAKVLFEMPINEHRLHKHELHYAIERSKRRSHCGISIREVWSPVRKVAG